MVVGSRTSLSQTVFDIFDELLVAIYEVCLLRPPQTHARIFFMYFSDFENAFLSNGHIDGKVFSDFLQ